MERRSNLLGFQKSTTKPSSSSSSSWTAEKNNHNGESTEKANSPIVGTCPDMCPARERAQRERLRDLSVFERLNHNPARTSRELAVKKFCRTISTMDTQPSDVRPLHVLQNTLTYLLSLLDCSEYRFELVHDFVFDRTRSIRQDLTMQNIINDQAIHIYEEMVKFHIISHHTLPRCSGTPNLSSVHHLNMEQLLKSLASLYDLYEVNRRSNSVNKNEAEFCSFYVLLHLGSKTHSTRESLSLWFQGLASSIINSKELSFARRVLRFFRMCNYKQFFCTIAAEVSYLQYCLMEPFINEVRIQAISCINFGGYKLHPYPLAHLSKLLMMKELDLESLCNDCGLQTSTDEAGNKLLPTKQSGFSQPKGGYQNYSLLELDRLERGHPCFWCALDDSFAAVTSACLIGISMRAGAFTTGMNVVRASGTSTMCASGTDVACAPGVKLISSLVDA